MKRIATVCRLISHAAGVLIFFDVMFAQIELRMNNSVTTSIRWQYLKTKLILDVTRNLQRVSVNFENKYIGN